MADGFANRLNADPVGGTPTYSAQAERLFALLGAAPGATALQARAGRRLGSGLELTVAADGLSATVQPGICVVPAPNSTSGPYVCAIPTAKTITLPAKPGAGLQRRDLVVVRVYDEDIAEAPTTLREVRIELVTGSAAASPSAPALPLMAYTVGELNSTSTATTVQSTNLSRTWSAGGVGVVYSQTERDALALYDGLIVYRDDLDVFDHRVAGAWQQWPETDTGWTTLGGPAGAFTNATFHPVRVRRRGPHVTLQGTLERSPSQTWGPASPIVDLWTLATTYRPDRTTYLFATTIDYRYSVRVYVDESGVVRIGHSGTLDMPVSTAIRINAQWIAAGA